MGYLLPIEWTSTFIPLQDKCPVSSFESIREMILQDTGQPIDELFTSFEPMPTGAASLAQVHIATLKETGQKVAVKVQHPALAEWVPLDLALTRFTFSMLKRFFPEYDLEWLSREMDLSLPQELDFRMEAQNATVASEYFKKHSDVPLLIPEGEYLSPWPIKTKLVLILSSDVVTKAHSRHGIHLWPTPRRSGISRRQQHRP